MILYLSIQCEAPHCDGCLQAESVFLAEDRNFAILLVAVIVGRVRAENGVRMRLRVENDAV